MTTFCGLFSVWYWYHCFFLLGGMKMSGSAGLFSKKHCTSSGAQRWAEREMGNTKKYMATLNILKLDAWFNSNIVSRLWHDIWTESRQIQFKHSISHVTWICESQRKYTFLIELPGYKKLEHLQIWSSKLWFRNQIMYLHLTQLLEIYVNIIQLLWL